MSEISAVQERFDRSACERFPEGLLGALTGLTLACTPLARCSTWNTVETSDEMSA